jgi:hypothetical protein
MVPDPRIHAIALGRLTHATSSPTQWFPREHVDLVESQRNRIQVTVPMSGAISCVIPCAEIRAAINIAAANAYRTSGQLQAREGLQRCNHFSDEQRERI